MSTYTASIVLAPSDSYLFQNVKHGDLLIRTSASNQRIHLGTSNNAVPAVTIGSNHVNVDTESLVFSSNTTATFEGPVVMNDSLSLTGLFVIDGDMTVNSNTTIYGALSNFGDASFDSAVVMKESLTLTGPLVAVGNATISSNLGVLGTGNFAGGVVMEDHLHVQGLFEVDESATLNSNLKVLGTFSNTGDASFDSAVVMKESLTLTGPLVAVGNATISSNLGVLGTGNFAGGVVMNDYLHVQGLFEVDESATLNSNLKVLGTFSNTGDASFENNVHIKGSLFVSSISYEFSNINVYSATQFTSNITVDDDFTACNIANFYGPTTMSNDLSVTGAVSLSSNLYTRGWIGVGTSNPTAPIDIETSTDCNVSLYCSGKAMATEFAVYSDRRIKKEIEYGDSQEYLEMITKMQPCSYEYIDGAEKGRRRKMGFIAQDIEPVAPSCVDTCTGFIPNIHKDVTIVDYRPEQSVLTLDMGAADLAGLSVGDVLKVRNAAHSKHSTTAVVVKLDPVAGRADVKMAEMPLVDVRSVFIVGKKVDDFKVIHNDQLSSIAIGAIKMLYNTVQTLQSQIDAINGRQQTSTMMSTV